MSRNMKVFIIVCVVVFFTGFAATLVGITLHGWKDIDKLPGDWHINLESGQTETITLEGQDATFDSINLDVSLCQVEIIEGDAFEVEVKYDANMSTPGVEIEDQGLTISSGDNNLIGGNDEHFAMEIQITVPKGTTLKEADLNVDLGQLIIRDLATKNMEISLDGGELDVTGLEIHRAVFDLSLCSASIQLMGDQEDYDYEIQNELSSVSLNHADVNDIRKTSGQDKYFECDCDLSELDITFRN